MSIENNHISDIARDAKVQPPKQVWDRIEHKLNSHKELTHRRKKDAWKFWLSIAASLTVICTCIFLIYNESNRKDVLRSDYLVEWEDITKSQDYFYSVEVARQLNGIFSNNH